MKVCVTFHNDIFTPWPATSIVHPIEVLLEAGNEVVVVTWDKGRNIDLKKPTLQVRRETVRVPVRNALSFYEFSRKLSEKLVAERPDAILAFDLEVLKGSATAAGRLHVPLLFFAREDWPSMVRGEGTLSGRLRAAAFATMEKSICKRRVEHAYSVNPERGEKFIRWSVPYTTIYTTKGLGELPNPPDKLNGFSIAIAGSMLEMEALPNVLKAIRDLDCSLHLIGGDERNIPGVREIVASSGMNDRIVLTGHLPSVGDYYREIGKCSMGLTLPLNKDRNKYLGISVKMWDYMAMGLPQAVSNMPAMASIVIGDGSRRIGLAVDPMSSEEIKKAIVHYMSNPAEAVHAGSLARQLFIEKYCWDRQRELLKQSHWIFSGKRK